DQNTPIYIVVVSQVFDSLAIGTRGDTVSRFVFSRLDTLSYYQSGQLPRRIFAIVSLSQLLRHNPSHPSEVYPYSNRPRRGRLLSILSLTHFYNSGTRRF